MKKIFLIIVLALSFATAFLSCTNDDQTVQEKYSEWYTANDNWLKEQQSRRNPDGTPYYNVVTPAWNPALFVLMHYFNDPEENADKLSPIYTSTIRVYYRGYLYNDTPFDSSRVSNTDSRFAAVDLTLNNMIQGWGVAFPKMHCGDSAEIVIPYGAAYGTTGNSNGVIPPYSNLRFNVKLIDIPYYEAPPYQ